MGESIGEGEKTNPRGNKGVSKGEYHTDFSNIRIHTDDAAKALVGHEFAHIMQKGTVGGEMTVQESVSMGAEQGGAIWNCFKGLVLV